MKTSTKNVIISGVFLVIGALLGSAASNKNTNINKTELTVNSGDEKRTITIDDYLELQKNYDKVKDELAEIKKDKEISERDLKESNQQYKQLESEHDTLVKINESLSAEVEKLEEEKALTANNNLQETNTTQPETKEQTGKVYITDLDYFNKIGEIVKKEDTYDNLKTLRTNVITTPDSRSSWEYTYKINKKYKFLRGTIFVSYDKRTTNYNGFVFIYDGNTRIKEVKITGGKDPQPIDIDISNIEELRIKFNGGESHSILLSEVYLEP